MRWSRIVLVLVPTALASGCAGPRSQSVHLGGITAVATRGDLRVVTARPDPHPAAGLSPHMIVCAEPSPDVALALSSSLSLQASAKTSGADASGTVSRSASEAAIALAGRTAAVVALRDGLFRACEAYANGVIGRDAYGLILSQYGDLLVTVMLGEDAAHSGQASAGAAATDPVAAIAAGYMNAAGDRRRAAELVLCTMAAERARENPGQPGGTSDPNATRCGGGAASVPGR